MNTKVIRTDGIQIDNASLSLSAQILRKGGLVVFPTETVYGLGGNGTDDSAAKKIYAAKGRPSDNPLIIHISEPKQAEDYAYTNDTYYQLAKAFMPGPITVILPKKDSVPLSVTGGLDTVAIRCPSHPIARALIDAAGIPIAAPSANLSGKPSPTCARHVIEDLEGRVDVIIDGGDCEIGLESTIIRLDGNQATLLRPGAITADALLCVCESVTVAPSVLEELKKDERPLSPGMKYKHYAPEAPLVLLDGTEEDVLSFLSKEKENKHCAVLCYTEELGLLENHTVIDIGRANDLDTQARTLFTALRDADKLGVDVIYAHLPPKDGIGLALYNRMIRAAAHTIRKV
ncbi:MAG: threonylcarbamoyl-AMP synthase [Clostridia bacterium]|nr:threonylcarbamoyl-AMP synthase [Clostridia bacterium]